MFGEKKSQLDVHPLPGIKEARNLLWEICFASLLLPWLSVELFFRSHFSIFTSFAGTWPCCVFSQFFPTMVLIIIQRSYIFKHSVFKMANWIYSDFWNIHLFLFQKHLLLIDVLRIETQKFCSRCCPYASFNLSFALHVNSITITNYVPNCIKRKIKCFAFVHSNCHLSVTVHNWFLIYSSSPSAAKFKMS